MKFLNSRESWGENMWYYPEESWLVRMPDPGVEYVGYVGNTDIEGQHVDSFWKDFQERYICPQAENEGVIRVPNHSVLLTHYDNVVMLKVERAMLDWPSFEKSWTVKEGENWLDTIPSWIREYFDFEKG